MRRRFLYTPTLQITKLVKYGYLYNWYVTQQTGTTSITSSDTWRVPNDVDFNTKLFAYLTPISAGTKLKEIGTTYWQTGNTGTDIVNFHFRGGGYRASGGSFGQFKQYGYLWCTVEGTSSNGKDFYAGYSQTGWNATTDNKKNGESLRLCRDASAYEQTLADGTACSNYTGNDGLIYPTVKINTLVWLGSNLAETKYRNGSSISVVTGSTAWSNLTTPALCAYNNDNSNIFI